MKTTKPIESDPTWEFKVNTMGLLKEIFDNNPELGGVLYVPANTLRLYLGQIAQRASELNDNKLNAIMAQMALYAVTDPYCKEYDDKITKKLISLKYK